MNFRKDLYGNNGEYEFDKPKCSENYKEEILFGERESKELNPYVFYDKKKNKGRN